MDRRHYLTLAGGLLAGVAGCTTTDLPGGGDGGDGGATPIPTGTDATVEGTLAVNGTADLDRLDASFAQRAVGQYYLAVATAPAHGERLASALERGEERSGEAGSFLRDTDYGAASVVCIQDAVSSSVPDLELASATTTGDAATLAARYPGNAGTDDITTDLLLVRLAHPDIEHATVGITGQTGETVRFSTVGRYDRDQLDEPRPLVVRNRDCEAHRIAVSATVDGELVAETDGSTEVGAASVARHGAFLTTAATHAVLARRDGREATAETSVSPTADDGTPVGALVDIAGDGSVTVEGRPVADLPERTDATCEAASLPYESPDPGENVAEPARFEWVNRSGEDRAIRLVVRDGDRTVVDRTVSMPAGGKGHTEGLVAKRGVYETELRPETGEARRVDWQVDEARDHLQVMVEADGSLSVATSSLAN